MFDFLISKETKKLIERGKKQSEETDRLIKQAEQDLEFLKDLNGFFDEKLRESFKN